MSENVITFVADTAYLPHAKSFMVNCRRQGSYTGDFCVISPGNEDHSDLTRRGINVFPVPDAGWDFMVKFWAFTPYFHRWKRAFCTDLDVMVQGPLAKLFDGLGARLPKILADLEDGPTLGAIKYWDLWAAEHPEIFEEIARRFPHTVKERMFNAAFLFYEPASMPVDIRDQLLALNDEFKEANPTCADQMLLNLLLYDRMELAGKDYFCFFGMDYPCNRIPSDFRRWRGDEEPVVLHYTRWQAPWIVKPLLDPEMGGYRCHRLGRVCHELYAENLELFETEFPIL